MGILVRTFVIRVGLAGACLAGAAVPALADATAFVGLTATPTARRAAGFAVGGGLPIIRWEIEYSRTLEDLARAAPYVHTVMGNLVVQVPVPIRRMRFYGTTGLGIWGESSRNGIGDIATGTNIGGGAMMTLAGPLRLRLDYRVFSFRGSPDDPKRQRFYAGLNLAF